MNDYVYYQVKLCYEIWAFWLIEKGQMSLTAEKNAQIP